MAVTEVQSPATFVNNIKKIRKKPDIRRYQVLFESCGFLFSCMLYIF